MAIPSRRVFGVTLKSEFSFIYIYLVAGISLLIAVFLFVSPASAQTEEGTVASESAVVEESGEPVVGEQSGETSDVSAVLEAVPEQVTQDEQVTHEDLEVGDSQVLPDSPLYKFKRFGRGLKEAFTFDPVKKAEMRLRNANQELFDGQKLLEQSQGDEGKTEAAMDAIGRFEKKITVIHERIGGLQVKKEQGDEKVGEFLDRFVDREIKQQKILERLQEKIQEQATPQAEKVLERLEQVQEQSGKTAGETLTQIESNPERLVEHFERALESQRGGNFKDLRNLEVLKQLEDRAPEQAREAIQRAQENTLKRFSENVKELPEDVRKQGFEEYMHNVAGEEVRHMQIFDQLKQVGDLPPDVLQQMEEAKDVFATRFQERLQHIDAQFQDGEFKDRARERTLQQFDDMQGNDIEKLRAVEEIRRRVQFENQELQKEVEERHSQAIERFQQTFDDSESFGQVEKFKELSKKMAENPDPTTFRLIQELEERVKSDPKKREFVEKMEQEAKAQFADRAQKMQEKFFEQISSNRSEDMEIFKKLQEDFVQNPNEFVRPQGDEFLPRPEGDDELGPPPELRQFFKNAIERQAEFLGEKLETEEKLQNLPPKILEEIKRRQSSEGDRGEGVTPEGAFDPSSQPQESRREFEKFERVCGEECQREQKRFEERIRVQEQGPAPEGGEQGEQLREEMRGEIRERVQEFRDEKRQEFSEQRQFEPTQHEDGPRPGPEFRPEGGPQFQRVEQGPVGQPGPEAPQEQPQE